MRTRRLPLILLASMIAASCFSVASAAGEVGGAVTSADEPAVMLVVDTSGSMGDDDGTGTLKINGAKKALLNYVRRSSTEQRIGLMHYPDPNGAGCTPASPNPEVGLRDPKSLSANIRAFTPDGDTPTAEALTAAGEELGGGGTIILVSDGESNCEDPCEAAKTLADQGTEIEAITVGFKISDEGRKELQCIADALGGQYVDVDNTAELNSLADKVSQPQLKITNLNYPKEAVGDAGGEADGTVRISAKIRNDNSVPARNVTLRLRFEENDPGVIRPIVKIGNLAPGEEKPAAWNVWPDSSAIGGSMRFSVIGSATNNRNDAVRSGAIKIRDLTTAAEAGPLLKDKSRIVILGDSFSSGEGGESYINGTDSLLNRCHQSENTYLKKMFSIPNANVIACSGNVANDVLYGDNSQLVQLSKLYNNNPSQIQAVVMTLGGNDYGFPKFAKSCIVMAWPCNETVFNSVINPFGGWKSYDDFVKGLSDPDGAEANGIRDAYTRIDNIVNSKDAVKSRNGAVAPIVVLAYPIPVPLTGRSCKEMLKLVSDGEVDAAVKFAGQLNGLLEGIVGNMASKGRPVYFVPATENSFQPNHSVCDKHAYARSLSSLDLGGKGTGFVDRIKRLADLVPNRPTPASVVEMGDDVTDLANSFAEGLHPNADGYSAESRAILRWTRGPGGAAAYASTVKAKASGDGETIPKLEAPISPTGNPILQGGSNYPLQADGFSPQSDGSVFLMSSPRFVQDVKADATGTIDLTIPVYDDLENGQHHIVIYGTGQNGKRLVKRIPFRIDDPWRPSLGVALSIFALIAGLIALLILAFSKNARRELRALLSSSRGDSPGFPAASHQTPGAPY